MVERRPTIVLGRGVGVGAGRQQQFDYLRPIEDGREHEWGCAPGIARFRIGAPPEGEFGQFQVAAFDGLPQGAVGDGGGFGLLGPERRRGGEGEQGP
jgi:hypothetical protein